MKKLVIASVLSLIMPMGANAAIITSIDRATFQAAASGGAINVQNFDSLAVGSILGTVNGVTYSASSGSPIVTDSFLTTTGSNGLGSTSTGAFRGSANEGARFVFDTAITAFAIDINTFAGGNGAFRATFNTGPAGSISNSIFQPFPGHATGQFIGFISDTSFTTITISAVTGFNYTLDTLVFGDAADLNAEVPLPAALPLLLSGLAGLGFASRRKRRSGTK